MHTKSWQRGWGCVPSNARRLVRAAWIWLFAGLALVAARETPAQQFTFHQYQQLEGLSNLSVTCLLQDRAGFVWICTEGGLFRHDGVGFERFGEIQGIDDTGILGAAEDSSGALWVSTARDLYRREGLGFKAVRPEGRNLALAAGFRIAPLAPGHMLVIDAGQLIELSLTSDGVWHSQYFFTQAQLGATPALERLNSVHVDRHGRIWLGCGGAICRIEGGHVDVFDALSGVPDDTWRAWLLDREGRLWARGLAHVAALEAGASRFETHDPLHSRLTTEVLNAPLVEDLEGRILISGDTALSRWQENGWQDLIRGNGIANDGISALLVTRDGQVWLGLHGHGLARWLGYGHFESWTLFQGLGDLHVQAILRDADRSVLVATRAGCNRLDPTLAFVGPCRFGDLPPGEIRTMTQARGVLWIGMMTGDLFRVNTGDAHAAWVARVPRIRKLYLDSGGRLWICTGNGVGVIEYGATRIELMPLPARLNEVNDVTQDAQGAIWLATQGGLLRWSDGRFLALPIDNEQARAGFVTVAADRGGWLWAGAASTGMLHVHVEGDRVDDARWVPDALLTRASVHFTTIDPRGWVWAGTDAGVAVFDGRIWRRFNTEDGLIWNDTVRNSVFADTDGSIWIGTGGGLTHIQNPEALMQDQPIDLRITRATLGPQGLDAQSATPRWRPNMTLDLHLVQLTYGQASRSYLQVRLRGLGDDWFETRSRDLHFPALRPGHYTFEAVAIDPNRQQKSALTHFSFEILPPWWQTFWFRWALAAALIAVLGMGWNVYMRRLAARKREAERQKKEHEALLVRATRDALTGLWNRSAILEILSREINSAQRRATPLAVAIIDIDHFKRINDSRGHLAGDAVLRTLGAKLITKVRGSDSLGRYGGEEFLLVMPGAPMQPPFLPVERLQRAVAEIPVTFESSTIKITASFGVAWFIAASDTVESLLSRADEALYGAKDAGRNRVQYAATG